MLSHIAARQIKVHRKHHSIVFSACLQQLAVWWVLRGLSDSISGVNPFIQPSIFVCRALPGGEELNSS